MTVGLPGIGIGGIFYVLCGFLMPAIELVNTIRGRSSKKRWRMVATQFGFVCVILAAFWVIGLLLGLLIEKVAPSLISGSQTVNLLRAQPFFISLMILALVIIVFHILTLFSFSRSRKISNNVSIVKVDRQKTNGKLTILVPAYNEADSIADTIRSLQNQTVPIHEIIVIDDVSKDNTFDIARSLGVTVISPPKNTGSKAGAQNFGLTHVKTEFTMAIDADTTVAPDGIEKLLEAFSDQNTVAACGFVIPRHCKTIWERGRYVEYLFAFSFYKQIQDYFTKPLISSRCFSVYRTKVLKENGGWSLRTLAEDMDLTWTYHIKGYGVRFIPEALCYPIEPHNFSFMRKQLKRWSHGFVQNIRLHWREVKKVRYLNSMITVALWDASVASIVYLLLLPLLAIVFMNPLFLLGYVIDIPAVLVPTLFTAVKRREVGRLLISLPCFFILRTVNALFMSAAIWNELIMKRTFMVYEKGH